MMGAIQNGNEPVGKTTQNNHFINSTVFIKCSMNEPREVKGFELHRV